MMNFKKNSLCRKLIILLLMFIILNFVIPSKSVLAMNYKKHVEEFGEDATEKYSSKLVEEYYKDDLPDKYNDLMAQAKALKAKGFKENEMYICYQHNNPATIEVLTENAGYYAKKLQNGNYSIYTSEGKKATDIDNTSDANDEETPDHPMDSEEQQKQDAANQNQKAEHAEAAQGGKLLTPIFDLLMSFGDGVMEILQKAIIGTSASVSLDFGGKKILKVVLGIIAAIAVIVAISIVTAGIGAVVAGIGGFVGATLTAIGGSTVVSTIITVGTLAAAAGAYSWAVNGFSAATLPDITVFPTYSIGPEEIFEGKLMIFDVNFFNPKQVKVRLKSGQPDKDLKDYKEDEDGDALLFYYKDGNKEVATSKQSTSIQLSSTISKWYYAIRNLALVVMMLILVYIGIRMMLCSIAAEKAKYKKMLGDWVISMCLVFVLHYIMVFAVNINESIVKLVNSAIDQNKYAIALDDLKNKGAFIEVVEGNSDLKQGLVDANNNAIYDENGNDVSGAGEPAMFIWPTNLMGMIRMSSQMQNGSVEYVGYALAFLVLVFYTIFFTFTYLKRVIYMAFLTVIAPLVAMTYSIDKIADGKAQAFDMWLKEYIFNLLLQPVHLLLYMLLISMSFDLAGKNIIYTLVAIGFMMPAEKLIRKMFGFEKASTPGFLGGVTGAAVTMNALQKLDKFAGRGPGGKGGPSGEKPPKMKNNEDDPKGIYDRSADKGFADLYPDGVGDDGQVSGGPSAADAISGGNSGEDPVRRAERELLEEQIADGQIDESELTDAQRVLLGRNNTEDQQDDQQDNQQDGELGRFARFKKVSSMNLQRQFGNKDAWKKRIASATATTLRGGTKLAGTVLGAGIGAAAGIATGDVQNVTKNAYLGGSIGNSLGTGLVNRVADPEFGSRYQSAKTEYEKDAYGEEYSKKKKENQDSEFIKDTDARKHYAREFSSELNALSTRKEKNAKLDEIMNQAVEYRKHGVTDNKLITKAMKLDRGNKTASDSIAAAMMANKATDLDGIAKYQEQLSKHTGTAKAKEVASNAAKLNGLSLDK